MKNYIVTNKKKRTTVNPDTLLKVMTLLSLKDALCEEAYEKCPTIIKKAAGYGAVGDEIDNVLTNYKHKIRGGLPSEGIERKGRRLRF